MFGEFYVHRYSFTQLFCSLEALGAPRAAARNRRGNAAAARLAQALGAGAVQVENSSFFLQKVII